ncbi:hypothetical protein Bca4012_084544 [Brassica carinata]|uniref:Uncharacterized protein n=1 Tax=Brassica carinata TaxID=52824 RepID=A0A8X7SH38_BRACI|nr:hypothetical protein Bca52824_026188 [Brassica carinata]
MVVENLHKLKQSKPSQYTFEHLLELIGIEEEDDCTTAWGTKQLLKKQKSYTHCELDLSFLLGVSCAIVSFANHDHGRRVLYSPRSIASKPLGSPQRTLTSAVLRCPSSCSIPRGRFSRQWRQNVFRRMCCSMDRT